MNGPDRIWLDNQRNVATRSEPSAAWRDIYPDEYLRADLTDARIRRAVIAALGEAAEAVKEWAADLDKYGYPTSATTARVGAKRIRALATAENIAAIIERAVNADPR